MITRAYVQTKLLVFSYALLLSSAAFTTPLYANPQNGVVVAGQATITNSPGVTQINQSTDKAIINWQGFSIDANEHTRFQQPNSNSITLNRVTGNQASKIMGKLSANGKIMLLNPAGIIIGPNSSIDVAGLVATTANIDDHDFMSGNLHFVQNPANNAGIVNQGAITVADRGLVALVAPSVQNNGKIVANLGKVTLAAGTEFTVDLQGDETIQFTTGAKVTQPTYTPDGQLMRDSVANSGQIYANGGKVILSAAAAENIVDNAINMDGVIEARSLQGQNGKIVLAANQGTARVAGKLDVSGLNDGETGGTVHVLGKDIKLVNGSVINASGHAGGGEILVGGNYQGKGPQQNAKTTTVESNVLLDASATQRGNGGKVVVWADDTTKYQGHLAAKGGQISGNGGVAEVSGKHILQFQGTVDLKAPQGKTGSLLLDPEDIIIQATGSTTGGFTNPYISNSDSSILLVSDLVNALNNADVTIQTGSTGAQSGNITVSDAITWGNGNQLTLSANNSIFVNASITNTAGGDLVLRANSDADTATGSTTNTVVFGDTGLLNFTNNGTIKINYNPISYTTPTDFSSALADGTSPTLTAYMLVNNVNDLQNMNLNLAGDYALGADIDASSTASTGFTPIGNMSTAFSGDFDGNGYTIDSLNMSYTGSSISAAGLFGNSSGTINNAKLTNINITINNTTYAGGLVGRNTGTVSNSSTSGTLTSNANATGGLIGFNVQGTVTDSYSNVNVSSSSVDPAAATGGLIGSSNSGTISQVFSSGTVTGTNRVGGLIGQSTSDTISNAYSTSSAIGTDAATGITGGLIGAIGLDDNTGGSNLTNVYATGYVFSANSTLGAAGALIGIIYDGTLTNGYWNSATSNEDTAIGTNATGSSIPTTEVTTFADMMASNTFNGFAIGSSSSPWSIIEGLSFPYLNTIYTETPIALSGKAYSSGYCISSCSSTTVGGGNAIGLVIAGKVYVITATTDDSSYYFLLPNGAISNQTPALIYNASGSNQGNTIIQGDDAGSSHKNIALYANSVVLQNFSTTQSLNTNQLAALKGSLSGSNFLYTVDGNGNIVMSGSTQFATAPGQNVLISNPILTSSGNITLDRASVFASLSSTSGNIRLDQSVIAADIFATSGDITLVNNTLDGANGNTYTIKGGSLTLSGNINDTVSGTHGLLLQASSSLTISGNIGNSTPINNLKFQSNASITGDITTVNDIIFNNAATLASTIITSTQGDITFFNAATAGPTTTINTNNGTMTFAQALDASASGVSLTLNGDIITFIGAVGNSTNFQNLQFNTANTVNIHNIFQAPVNTSGNNAHTVNLYTSLAGATITKAYNILSSSGGTINIHTPLNTNFAEAVNFTKPITLTTANATIINSLTNSSALSISGDWLAQTDNFNFNAPVTLIGNTTFATPNNIIINSPIDGNYALALNSFGLTTITSSLGSNIPLYSFANSGLFAPGTLLQLGANITTQNGMLFNNPITLTANTVLTNISNGDIDFNETINGTYNLTVNNAHGNINFTDIIGGTQALNNLIIGNAVNVTVDEAVYANAFTQLQGSGTTDFINGFSQPDKDININTGSINGAITANNVTLTAANNITSNITASNNATIVTGSLTGNVIAARDVNITARGNIQSNVIAQNANLTANGTVTANVNVSNAANIIATFINNTSVNADTAYLKGVLGVFATVTANSLTLSGVKGGIISATIAGHTGEFAAFLTQLAGYPIGNFVVNGCLLPGGCVDPVNTNSVINTIVNSEGDGTRPLTCTAAAANASKEGSGDCGSVIKIEEDMIYADNSQAAL